MSTIVNIPLATRRTMPAPRKPGAPVVNPNAIGRVGMLMAQIMALEAASAMPAGATVEIVGNGARTLVISDRAGELAESLQGRFAG